MVRAGVAAFLVMAAGLTSACGARTPAGTAPAPEDDPGVLEARADSIKYPYTEADIAFMSGMISHHAQAIEMSRLAPSRGASPAIIRLTERIINAQTDEITLMQRWLRDRRQPIPPADPRGMKMSHGGVEHYMAMPGMLTDQQMSELRAARGMEFDRLFLTFMIQHHRGAVAMVQELNSRPGAAANELVFRFAADVAADQTTEINRMATMLLELGGTRSP